MQNLLEVHETPKKPTSPAPGGIWTLSLVHVLPFQRTTGSPSGPHMNRPVHDWFGSPTAVQARDDVHETDTTRAAFDGSACSDHVPAIADGAPANPTSTATTKLSRRCPRLFGNSRASDVRSTLRA